MPDDEFTRLMERLRAQAVSDEEAHNLDRFHPDDVVNPPATLRQLVAREVLRQHNQNRIDFHQHQRANINLRWQIDEAAQSGTMSARGRTIQASEGTLITLLALAMRQTAPTDGQRAPMYVLSLMRSRAELRSPHDHGLGIDITRYNGHYFRGPTAEAFEGLLDTVRNLPPGTFELGVPRAPRETHQDRARYHSFRIEGEPVYRPGEPVLSPALRGRAPPASVPPSEAWAGPSNFLHPDMQIRRSPSRRGFHADLQFMHNSVQAEQLRRAADESDGTIRLIFPDEPNHVHITVDIDEAWTNTRRGRR